VKLGYKLWKVKVIVSLGAPCTKKNTSRVSLGASCGKRSVEK
jgi:hypothetical protein